MLSTHDMEVVNLDKLSYGSNPANLKEIEEDPNYCFVRGDICEGKLLDDVSKDVNAVINIAADTHVDRSISNPRSFLDNNTMGVLNLLEMCRRKDIQYLQVSTDEVYGPSLDGHPFREEDRLNPSSPYSATKAAADMLVNAYHKTYGLRTLTTRCTNNYGPYQFPEKLVPKAIIRASLGLRLPIYGSGHQIRDWISVADHCEAIKLVLEKGKPGEIYNICGGNQIENLEIVERILRILGKPKSLIDHVEDRPGHDFRYCLDASKIEREIGWKPKRKFEEALNETVQWYINNEEWWKPLASDKLLSPAPWKKKW
jgi:dTDP-glucose 4,6-dehydratase